MLIKTPQIIFIIGQLTDVSVAKISPAFMEA
jgi:hypothetical protein